MMLRRVGYAVGWLAEMGTEGLQSSVSTLINVLSCPIRGQSVGPSVRSLRTELHKGRRLQQHRHVGMLAEVTVNKLIRPVQRGKKCFIWKYSVGKKFLFCPRGRPLLCIISADLADSQNTPHNINCPLSNNLLCGPSKYESRIYYSATPQMIIHSMQMYAKQGAVLFH